MQLGTQPALFAYTGGKTFDPVQPCVVFLHGAQHDHSVWILQSRFFAHHGYSVLALDLPGHGASDGPALKSVEEIAACVAVALASLPLDAVLLVGHSMGALIALELARCMGTRVAGVALLATAAPMRVADALLEATRAAPEAAMQMINVWSHRAGIAPFAARPSNPGPGFNIVWSNLRLMQRVAQRNGASVLINDFAACNDYRAGLEAAHALRAPTLILLGSADQMTPPRAAADLIAAIEQPKTIVTLARTGHALMAENPDGVRVALLEFGERVFARKPAAAMA